MDTVQKKNFEVALRRWLFSEAEDYGKVRRLKVIHMLKDGKQGGEVGRVKVPSDYTPESTEDLINEVEHMCMADSSGIGDVQKYHISPVFEKSSSPTSRFILKIEPIQEGIVLGSEDDETDNKKGASTADVAATMMRHNENIMRMAIGQPGVVMGQMNRIIVNQQTMIEQMQEKFWTQANDRLKILSTLEDMISQRHERELEAERSKQKMELTGELGNKLLLLAPAVVNRITGKKVLPETVTPEGMMMREFMKTVTPDQMGVLMKTLTADQQMLILGMYQQFQQEEELKKAKESAAKPAGDEKATGQ